MDPKPKVVLNCRSARSLLPALQKSLRDQSILFELTLVESSTCPSRMSQIDDERSLYFFFDEDIELPTSNYLETVLTIFKKNPELLFLGGKYLSHPEQSYLAKSYNSQIEFWLRPQGLPKSELIPCQNLPGGAWIISGNIKKHLQDWNEPLTWAGEDTFAIRWLQKKSIQIFYHSAADVLHYPRADLIHFCKRGFLQGKAREKFKLRSLREKLNWSFIWQNRSLWAGWGLHQLCVELGSLLGKIESLIAKKTPAISPKA